MSGDSIPKTLDGIKDLYEGNLAEYGTTSKSVGWRDDASQELRFERLVRVIDTGVADFTVNDWGCGYGAMFGYLDRRCGPRLARYTGYDISQEMLDAARRQCEVSRTNFVLGSDVTEAADYTFVSGTFNVRLQASDTDWEAYIKRHLEAMFAKSRRGLAFNLLTSYVDWKAEDLFYADPKDFFDFCKTRLSRFVTLHHDYGLYEWTIAVTREPRS
ncbi:MAG TPA: class I SAM-dependent methyltransferase [Vicinamibacterales bacterium]|nr:class I SAM-dependent methyltransferase [Vicinamibacterales bacterium]